MSSDTPGGENASPVRYECRDAIAVLTLNAPETRNALTPEMRALMIGHLARSMADPAIRIVVVAGNGGAFCSGGDIRQMGQGGPVGAKSRITGTQDIVRLIVTGGKPVIAAVEGPAFGAGLGLAAASDLVLATPETRFSASFVRLGLIPDAGLLATLPRRVGLSVAKRMLLEGTALAGEEALRLGLVDQLVPAGRALEAALDRARSMSRLPPTPAGLVKALYAGGAVGLEEAFGFEVEHQLRLFETPDYLDARTAFLEKRSSDPGRSKAPPEKQQ